MESAPRQDGSPRRLRNLQPAPRRSRLPHGSKRAIQSHLQHRCASRIQLAHQPHRSPTCQGPPRSRRRPARRQNAHAHLLFVAPRAGTHSQHIPDPGLRRLARIPRTHRHRWQYADPHNLPSIRLPFRISRKFPCRARQNASPRRILLHPRRNAQSQPNPGQYLDVVFKRQQQLQRAPG